MSELQYSSPINGGERRAKRIKPNAIVIALLTFFVIALLNVIASHSWVSFNACPASNDNMPFLQQKMSSTTISKRKTKQQPSHQNDDDDIYFINMTNYHGPARAFPVYPYPFPCVILPKWKALMKTTPASEGLFFQRPYKTGSTTMAGIVMRIARRKAAAEMARRRRQLFITEEEEEELTKGRMNILDQETTILPTAHGGKDGSNNNTLAIVSPTINDTTDWFNNNASSSASPIHNATLYCQHRCNHGSAVNYRYAQRNRQRSFLMTLVRNPTKRVISQFFHFGVAALRLEPTDTNFQNYLTTKMRAHPVLNDASLYNIPASPHYMTLWNMTAAVQQIMDGYDFIAVTERFDESLVALKMILNLDFNDILYTRDRSGGSFTNGDAKTRPCVYLVPSFVTPGMKQFFKSDVWKHRIRGEVMLYQAASKSLTLTIETLGREEFSKQLAYFLQLKRAAQAICEPREVGMCSESGNLVPLKNRTCIIWSEGCSDACLDEISTDLLPSYQL